MMDFDDYKKMAEESFKAERYGRYVSHGGKMLKKHPPATWRPIDWCDRCKGGLSGGLSYNAETDEALCHSCSDENLDGAGFASIGIIWDA